MSLKINYLDQKKKPNKNKAIFVNLDSKISTFEADSDDKTNQKIINFLKSNKIV